MLGSLLCAADVCACARARAVRDMRRVAEEVAANSGGRVVLREIRWKTFNDGFPNLFIEVWLAISCCCCDRCCCMLFVLRLCLPLLWIVPFSC